MVCLPASRPVTPKINNASFEEMFCVNKIVNVLFF